LCGQNDFIQLTIGKYHPDRQGILNYAPYETALILWNSKEGAPSVYYGVLFKLSHILKLFEDSNRRDLLLWISS